MAWTERYVTTTGAGAHDGTSEANAWSLSEAITNASSGHRVNVKVGTYSSGSDLSKSITGQWWRGYNTTIGDCWGDPTLTRPNIAFSGDAYLGLSGSGGIWSCIDVTSGRAYNGAITINTSSNITITRCVVSNTYSSGASTAYALQFIQNDGGVVEGCYLSAADSTANVIAVSHNISVRNTTLYGGKNGIQFDSAGGTYGSSVIGCVFRDNGTHGIYYNQGGASLTVDRCSFYSPGTDGIRYNSLPTGGTLTNCIFTGCGGYGTNNATGANEWKIHRAGNLFYSNTSGNETGWGDVPSIDEQTDSATPFTNAGSGDFSLVSTSNGKANGTPGVFFGMTGTESFLDIGAVQREEPTGGGGVTVIRKHKYVG